MFDSISRFELSKTIDDFLEDKIGAFEFEDRIFSYYPKSNDDTVKNICDILLSFYDGRHDHKVCLNKEGWDCINRLKLVLNSKAELSIKIRKDYSYFQMMAAIISIISFLIIYRFSFSSIEAFWVCIANFILIFIRQIQLERADYNDSKFLNSIFPFKSIKQIFKARKEAREFSKKRIPPHVKNREIEPFLIRIFNFVHGMKGLIFLSPFLMAIYIFPRSVTEYEINFPEL